MEVWSVSDSLSLPMVSVLFLQILLHAVYYKCMFFTIISALQTSHFYFLLPYSCKVTMLFMAVNFFSD